MKPCKTETLRAPRVCKEYISNANNSAELIAYSSLEVSIGPVPGHSSFLATYRLSIPWLYPQRKCSKCWTTSDTADRDKRLHDTRLPSARSKQSARACCPTSVLSVAPSQTHSRDPQLPGTPLRRQLLCPLPEPASHLGLRTGDR